MSTSFSDSNLQAISDTTGLVAFPNPIFFTFGVLFNSILEISTSTAEGRGDGTANADFSNTAF